MLRTAIWMGMTTVGTALLASTTFGFTLPAAFLLSAAISAVLANIDNMPDHGRRGYHYVRPVFSPWSFGFFGNGPSIHQFHTGPVFRGTPRTTFNAPPPGVPLQSHFRHAHPPATRHPVPQVFSHLAASQPMPAPGTVPVSTRFEPAASAIPAATSKPLYTSFRAKPAASPAFSSAASAPLRSASPGVAPISSSFRPANTGNTHNGKTPISTRFVSKPN